MCGVQKKKRAVRHSGRRSAGGISPVSTRQSRCETPHVSQKARSCCSTSGFVGATNAHAPSGNQRPKLCITTDAMSVFPKPVGSETSVFSSSAARAIASWYSRTGRLVEDG